MFRTCPRSNREFINKFDTNLNKNTMKLNHNDITYEIQTDMFKRETIILFDANVNELCRFVPNMEGLVPNFTLTNDKNVVQHFAERCSQTQLREFKKAIKNGYNNITIIASHDWYLA